MMPRLLAAALALVAIVLAAPSARAEGEERVALVIGNGAYRHAPVLANPVNDATGMAETLRALGFEVISVTDADRNAMVRAIGQFRRAMKADGVGLFYYAGHGMQVGGRNYLLPIDADIAEENDAAFLAIDLDSVQRELENAGVRLSLYVLDACRDNPFERRFRSAGSRGLAAVDAARGSVIAFATAPGKTAADGYGQHGLFTGELLKTIVKPGLELEEVLKQTAAQVGMASGNRQTPWYNSAFYGHFFFKAPVTVNVAPSSSPERDIIFWESIKSSKDPADFRDFLSNYPKSDFASLAQRRLGALSQPQPAPEPRAQAPAPTSAPPAAAPPPPVAGAPKAEEKPPVVAMVAPPAAPAPAEGEAAWSVDDRREVQQALKALGHFRGQPDGEFGPPTRAAIAQFQSFSGAAGTGVLTEPQRRALLDESVKLATLLAEPAAASPSGMSPASVRSGAQRLTRAASVEKAGNVHEAAYWYRLAADDGEAKAYTNLGTLMVRGQATGKLDRAAARLLWLAAAARAEPVAMFNLGAMYENGIGVAADKAVARAWYERAAAKGHPQARDALKRLGG
jgi:peptidoglycan hydrolase-like protein with peptidoglycan-binding domain